MEEMKNVSTAETSAQEKADAKRRTFLRFAWPSVEIGGGLSKAYFSTYANYLYTNVYVLGALFSGILAIVQNIVRWIGGPTFGVLIDRINFKKGKYYPWIFIGYTIYYGAWILLFSLPVFGLSTAVMRPVAMVLVLVNAVFGTGATAPVHGVFPQITKDTKERQLMAMLQKIFRDGGKTVFGYICPAVLMFFTVRVDESKAYAITGLIIGIVSLAFYLALGFGLRGSYVERNALERSRTPEGKKKKMSILQTFKTIFTNKALVSMYFFTSFQKCYYFIFFSYATYLFNYVFGDMGLMATFMLVFNFAAILGAMFGPVAQKAIKEAKQMLMISTAVQIVILVVTAIFLRQLTAVVFIGLFAVLSFFMGLVESFFMPMFASASDYCAWKTGVSMDGLNMSIYSVSISTGLLVSSVVSTTILTSFGLDAVVASGVATDTFLGGLNILYGWIPVVFACCSLLAFFLFPLNSTRMAQVSEDLAAGKTAATSEHKF